MKDYTLVLFFFTHSKISCENRWKILRKSLEISK